MRLIPIIFLLISQALIAQELIVPGENIKIFPSGRAPTLCRTKTGFCLRNVKFTSQKVTSSYFEDVMASYVKFHTRKTETAIIAMPTIQFSKFGKITGRSLKITPDIPRFINGNYGSNFCIETIIKNNRIISIISIGDNKQTLLDSDYPDGDMIRPLWVGDLDSDGIPDILCAWGHEDSVGGSKLFLSQGSSTNYSIYHEAEYGE